MFYDISINLICSLFSFVLGCIIKNIITYFGRYSKTRIWKLLSSDSRVIIGLSMRDGPNLTSTMRASMAEVSALTDILPILKDLKIKYSLINNNANISLDQHPKILSIGGPKANKLTDLIWRRYKTKLPIRFLDNPPKFIIGEKEYITKYSEDGTNVLVDYAVVLVIYQKNKECLEKCRIVVFGCRGYGTEGGLISLSSKEMTRYYNKYKPNTSFAAIIKVECENRDELRTSIEEFYPLEID